MTKSKKIFVTEDFYAYFELYETTDPDDFKTWVSDMVNERYRKIDDSKHKLIGDCNTMDTDEATEMADEIIWCNDLVEIEE